MDGGYTDPFSIPESLDLDTEEQNRPPPVILEWQQPQPDIVVRSLLQIGLPAAAAGDQRPPSKRLEFEPGPVRLLSPSEFHLFFNKLRELAAPSVKRAAINSKEYCKRVLYVVKNFLLNTPLKLLVQTLDHLDPTYSEHSYIAIQSVVLAKVSVLLKQACVTDLQGFLALCDSVGVKARIQ